MIYQSNHRLEINLTPLLDLVLQLIMFFMLTVNLVRADQVREGVELPVVQSAMPTISSEDEFVDITIGKDGSRSVNEGLLRSDSELIEFLNVRKDALDHVNRNHGLVGPAKLVVVVRADKKASWGEVWETLDLCSRAGFPHWRLRVIKQAE